MRVGISNIAWDTQDDGAVSELLGRYGIKHIDIAPGKYFENPVSAREHEILKVKRWWNEQGISLYGMQSLLFGTSGLNLFSQESIQKRMLDHLESVIRVAALLGITKVVFGSPKNRDLSGLTSAQADKVALDFFGRLGEIAKSYEVIVCIEPNPECYGCNFLTHTPEALEFVKALDHSAVKLQLDTGAIAINQEDPAEVIKQSWGWVGHLHASEPDLLPLGSANTNHILCGEVLNGLGPEMPISIEMRAVERARSLQVIEDSLRLAISHYGTAAEAGKAS